ncbi:MAG TPA: hypothetical protein VLH87_03925 [Pyrinomonadaceae bacterium]|nr:hypothetical protein [Pyrinomonadaceae bacterium]
MNQSTDKARTKREAIVEIWSRLERPPVGEQVLDKVQRGLDDKFGKGASDSPAAIARILADEGAELRHPEVIEFDARWREKNIADVNSGVIGDRDLEEPLTLKTAAKILQRFEKQRQRFMREKNQGELRGLREVALNEKARAQLLARDNRLDETNRAAQIEIAEWLRVWLQTPDIFEDWLTLRLRSADFRNQFPKH